MKKTEGDLHPSSKYRSPALHPHVCSLFFSVFPDVLFVHPRLPLLSLSSQKMKGRRSCSSMRRQRQGFEVLFCPFFTSLLLRFRRFLLKREIRCSTVLFPCLSFSRIRLGLWKLPETTCCCDTFLCRNQSQAFAKKSKE